MNNIGLHLSTNHPQGRGAGVQQAIRTAALLGVQSLQLAVCDLSKFFSDATDEDKELFKSAGQEAKDAGIMLVVHTCYVSNCAYDGPKASKFKLGLKSMSEMMKLADLLQAPRFVAHCGSFKEMGRKHGLEKLKETSLYLLGKDYKTTLCWENGAGGGTQAGHLEDVVELLRQLPTEYITADRIGLCLDTAHLYADGWDIRDQFDKVQRLVQPYLKAMHWNSPDQNVIQGKHLDRHTVSWRQGKFKPSDMRHIARLVEGATSTVPLIMEASGEGAYGDNFNAMSEWSGTDNPAFGTGVPLLAKGLQTEEV
jgi:deoxyribonuclease-4